MWGLFFGILGVVFAAYPLIESRNKYGRKIMDLIIKNAEQGIAIDKSDLDEYLEDEIFDNFLLGILLKWSYTTYIRTAVRKVIRNDDIKALVSAKVYTNFYKTMNKKTPIEKIYELMLILAQIILSFLVIMHIFNMQDYFIDYSHLINLIGAASCGFLIGNAIVNLKELFKD